MGCRGGSQFFRRTDTQTDQNPHAKISKGLFLPHTSLSEEGASSLSSRNEQVLLSLGEESFRGRGSTYGKEKERGWLTRFRGQSCRAEVWGHMAGGQLVTAERAW